MTRLLQSNCIRLTLVAVIPFRRLGKDSKLQNVSICSQKASAHLAGDPPTGSVIPLSLAALPSESVCTSCSQLAASCPVQALLKALPKLSNGKAPGLAGWPAELLRYSAYIEDENGRRKVWILEPFLADLLNACFIRGSIPACISSGVVTPIHKKGCTLDPANYRPVAVGEPLYRLYTVILNARLVHWTEQHCLRSPTQAGFRPSN